MSADTDESDDLEKINDWFASNIKGIRTDKRKVYAQLFYDKHLTTEHRILKQLSRYPNWLTENNVLGFDSEDILEYLQTKGHVTTTFAAQTLGMGF